MRTMYEITNKAGRVLCRQYATSASQAIEFARMYGHRGAANAYEVV